VTYCYVKQTTTNGIDSTFIVWLGENQRVAVDPETGEEYRWEDVLIFDQAISEKDQAHLKKAISEKQIIREAIFLISGSVLISLKQHFTFRSLDKQIFRN
ncbi:MAG: hypothetical protein MZV64_69690, partial [Ignavibacteriales bacterium]|nr:hypothetical protein [Ignavibacteriales bacterium]